MPFARLAGARDRRIVVAAVAATLVFFYRVLNGRMFMARDILRVYLPLHQYWASRVAHGEFPSWYPYDGLGEPFAGMLIGSPFHPLDLLYLALPLGLAMTLNVLVCFPIAFLGVYALARRWAIGAVGALLAAVVFAFGGYLVSITNNLPYLMAAATMPAALWASDRYFVAPTIGRATAVACVLTLVLFAGDPQSFVVVCALSGVVALARRGLVRAFLPVLGLLGLTAALGAVQTLPAVYVAREGKPASQQLEAAEAWSVHPLRAFDLALGPIFASESGDVVGAEIDRGLLQTSRNNLWVDSIHQGLPALILAGVALATFWRSRRTWLLVGATAAVASLALGKHAPVYDVLFAYVPGWRTFRYPEKLVPYVSLGVALAAGAGLDAALRDGRARRTALMLLGLGAVACLGLVALEWRIALFSRLIAVPLWHGRPSGDALVRLSTAFRRYAAESAGAVLLTFGVMAILPAGARGAAVVAVIFLGLFVANGSLYEVAPASILRPGPFASAIEAAEGPPRLGGWRVYRLKGSYGTDYDQDPDLAALDERSQYARSVETALDPVTPALWGLEGANKYLPGVSRRIADLADDDEEFAARHARLFGVLYLSIGRDDVGAVRGRGLERVAEYKPLWLFLARYPAPRRRVYLARPRCVRSAAEALQIVSSDDPLPADEAVVECSAPLPAAPTSGARLGAARIVSYAPERVAIHIDAASDALLVLNDAFYEGWSATVDGAPEAIVPVNYGVRGVPVGPGEHTVLFTYRTPGLREGACLSALVLAAVLLAMRLGPKNNES